MGLAGQRGQLFILTLMHTARLIKWRDGHPNFRRKPNRKDHPPRRLPAARVARHPCRTEVRAWRQRNAGAFQAHRGARSRRALRLDGEDLELVGARLDGRILAASDYQFDASGLVITAARDGSVLELDVRIDPARNSHLSGLYLSGSREHGFLLTQCEAQGFRR